MIWWVWMHYLILQSHVHHETIKHMAIVSFQQHAVYDLEEYWL